MYLSVFSLVCLGSVLSDILVSNKSGHNLFYFEGETALVAGVLRTTTEKSRQLFLGKKCIRVTWLEDFLTSKWPGSFTALAPTLQGKSYTFGIQALVQLIHCIHRLQPRCLPAVVDEEVRTCSVVIQCVGTLSVMMFCSEVHTDRVLAIDDVGDDLV